MTQKEIFKVGIYKEETQETLYPQIVTFVIWRGKQHFDLTIQGLQSISGNMTHMNGDGTIEIHVLENQTLNFEFGKSNSIQNKNWVTARVTSLF